jgi:hypothetical protein
MFEGDLKHVMDMIVEVVGRRGDVGVPAAKYGRW